MGAAEDMQALVPVARLQAEHSLKTLQPMASDGKPGKHSNHNNHKTNTTRTNINEHGVVRGGKRREREGKGKRKEREGKGRLL